MKVLLIPSAVLVPKDMQKNFGELPTGLFPLGDVPMLLQLYEKYKDKVDKIYITVYKKKNLVEKYVSSQKLPIEIIVLDKLYDLGYTIKFSIDFIVKQNLNVEYLFINFADSLLDDVLPETIKDIIYYSVTDNLEEWTYFKYKDGHILDLLDKVEIKENLERLDSFDQVFVGVFGIKNLRKFLYYLNNPSDTGGKIDSFYSALIQYNKDQFIDFIETSNWFDVGHYENYFKAKTAVAARAFNTIKIDEERGILTKTSKNKEKLIDEIRWYLKLPNKLQYLLPRIYEYSLSLDNPYVSMEYYGYHTLHESLLYGELPIKKWKDVFKKLLFVINDMEKFKVYNQGKLFEEAVYNIYVKKTFDRLNRLRNMKEFADFFNRDIIINNNIYKSIDIYLDILPKLVQDMLMKNLDGKFTIIHGDLCFTNILVEDSYNFMRFIDPRGDFGGFDIYGDCRYELAKLFHTVEGQYDFIIEDMFDISVLGTEINYHIHKKVDTILEAFLEVFKDKLNGIEEIRLIEATLFLSMIPLHNDSLKRQYAMLATGIQLLQSVIEKRERVE